MPPEMVIGCSTNNPEEARRAEADGADYASVGRLFPAGPTDDTPPAAAAPLRAGGGGHGSGDRGGDRGTGRCGSGAAAGASVRLAKPHRPEWHQRYVRAAARD